MEILHGKTMKQFVEMKLGIILVLGRENKVAHSCTKDTVNRKSFRHTGLTLVGLNL